MLSASQEKLIRSTHTKKGRQKSGLVLIEGEKLLKEAGTHVELLFSEQDSSRFKQLVTTVTPQMKAGLARLPTWTETDLLKKKTIMVLDHIQDPGNLGTILRSALAFDAGLLLVSCADVGNPKVIRSSAGSLFHLPWIAMKQEEAEHWIKNQTRDVYRLELAPHAVEITNLPNTPLILIAGSEGQGIQLDVDAPSVKIAHNEQLESLNVAVAVSLVLQARF